MPELTQEQIEQTIQDVTAIINEHYEGNLSKGFNDSIRALAMSHIGDAYEINQTLTAKDIAMLITINFDHIGPLAVTIPQEITKEEQKLLLNIVCMKFLVANPTLPNAVGIMLNHQYCPVEPKQPTREVPLHFVNSILNLTRQTLESLEQAPETNNTDEASPSLAEPSMFNPQSLANPEDQAGGGAVDDQAGSGTALKN